MHASTTPTSPSPAPSNEAAPQQQQPALLASTIVSSTAAAATDSASLQFQQAVRSLCLTPESTQGDVLSSASPTSATARSPHAPTPTSASRKRPQQPVRSSSPPSLPRPRSRSLTLSLTSPGVTDNADGAALTQLLQRFLALLSPSTERLILLRAALKGLQAQVAAMTTAATTPSTATTPVSSTHVRSATPNNAPFALPFAMQLRQSTANSPSAYSIASDGVSNGNVAHTGSGSTAALPRLCVTGLTDNAAEEVFQFLIHRDPTSAATAAATVPATAIGRGGSSLPNSSGSPTGALTDDNSVNPAQRPPTPDVGSLVASPHSPASSLNVSRRRSRMEVMSASPPAGQDGKGNVPHHLAKAVTVANVDHTSATRNDGSVVAGQRKTSPNPFPTTPPIAPAGIPGILVDSISATMGSPTAEELSLVPLAMPPLPGQLKGSIASPLRSAKMRKTTTTPPSSVPAVPMLPGLLLSPAVASTHTATVLGGTLGGSSAANTPAVRMSPSYASHLRTLSPHPPLSPSSINSKGGVFLANATDATQLPLPAAPANHHLRTPRTGAAAAAAAAAATSIEARALNSPSFLNLNTNEGSLSLGGDGGTEGESERVASSLSPHRHTHGAVPHSSSSDVMGSGGGAKRTEATYSSAPPFKGSEGPLEERNANDDGGSQSDPASSLSSTMPELSATPPPPLFGPSAVSTDAFPHGFGALPMSHDGSPTHPPPPLPNYAYRTPSAPQWPRALTEQTAANSPVTSTFRRQFVSSHAALPSPTAISLLESPALPAPTFAVLLPRTSSQSSEMSETSYQLQQRLARYGHASPPGTTRFNTLPAPFFSLGGGKGGRSLREDSALVSPGSSFTPSAVRLVRPGRRRNVVVSAALLRWSAWHLFCQDSTAELYRASFSMTATTASQRDSGSPDLPRRILSQRSTPGSRGGLLENGRVTPAQAASPELPAFSGITTPPPSEAQTPPATAAAGATSWVVGINDDGVLRYDASAHTAATTGAPPYAKTSPVATTSDYCLLCVPYEAARRVSTVEAEVEVSQSTMSLGEFGAPPCMTDGVAQAELVDTLDALFGLFSGSGWHTPQRAAAAVAPSILTPLSGGAVDRGGAASGGNEGSSAAGLRSSLLLSSLFSLESPTPETTGPFLSAAVAHFGGLDTSEEASGQRPFKGSADGISLPPSEGRGFGSEQGILFSTQVTEGSFRSHASESPRHAHFRADTVDAAHPLETTAIMSEKRSGSNNTSSTLKDKPVQGATESGPAVQARVTPASATAVADEWLRPLRQALVDRTVFVLVKSDVAHTPSPPAVNGFVPGAGVASSGNGGRSRDNTIASSATGGAGKVAHDRAMENFVTFVQSRYGVTVPSWRVCVFSHRDSVLTRNVLLSSYQTQQQLEKETDSLREDALRTPSPHRQSTPTEVPATAEATTITSAAAQVIASSPVTPPNPRRPSQGHGARFRKATLQPSPASLPMLSNGTDSRTADRSDNFSLHTSLPPLLPGDGSAGTFSATNRERAAQDGLQAIRNTLFAQLTKDVTVLPLATAVAFYAPLLLHSSAGPSSLNSSPLKAASSISKAALVSGGLRHNKLSLTAQGLTAPASPAANAMELPAQLAMENAEAPKPKDEDERGKETGKEAGSGQSMTTPTHAPLPPGSTANSVEDAVCSHALTVAWASSGARALHSAFRYFEHANTEHRLSRGAFPVMAWCWQLKELLPLVVRDAQSRRSRLQQSRLHTEHKLAAVQRSVDLHMACSPARSVAALEARLQRDFSEVTRRFMQDIRRLLATPPPSAATSTAAAGLGSSSSLHSATAASGTSAAASSPGCTPQPQKPSYPSLKELLPFETPQLCEAYRRLVQCVQRFHSFYLEGSALPTQQRLAKAPQSSTLPTPFNEDAAASAHPSLLTSLYERRYAALRGDVTPKSVPAAQYTSLSDIKEEEERRKGSDQLMTTREPSEAPEDAKRECSAGGQSILAVPSTRPGSPSPAGGGVASLPLFSPPIPPPSSSLPVGLDEVPMLRVDRSSSTRGCPLSRIASVIGSNSNSNSAVWRNSTASLATARAHTAPPEELPTVEVSPQQCLTKTNSAPAHRGDGAKEEATAAKASRQQPEHPFATCTRESREERARQRLTMERQLIAHVSQLNTELINFFLAACVSALPHLYRDAVQREVERVKSAHMEFVSVFTNAVRGRKAAAVALAHAYTTLDQWAQELGPLLSMVDSRHYIVKFITQLRAVLCEDQIRGLALYRANEPDRADNGEDGEGKDAGLGEERRGASGEVAPLTYANLASHRKTVAPLPQEAQAVAAAKGTRPMLVEARADVRPGQGALRGGAKEAAPPITGDVPCRTAPLESGLRTARFLRYCTRLACKPRDTPHISGASTAVSAGHDADMSLSVSTNTPQRHGSHRRSRHNRLDQTSTSPVPTRPVPFSSGSTPCSPTHRRLKDTTTSTDGLQNSASLTCMSAAWNREEEKHRSAVAAAAAATNAGKGGSGAHAHSPRYQHSHSKRQQRQQQPKRSGDSQRESANEGEASSSLPATFFAVPYPPAMATISDQLLAALGPPHAPKAAPPLPSDAAEKHAAALQSSSASPLSPHPADTEEGGDAVPNENSAASEWRHFLAEWRGHLSERERPTDISGAPLLWLLLDTWDEGLLRMPYGLLLQLSTARYATSLNSLSGPILESQQQYRSRLRESVRCTAGRLKAVEEDLCRIQGEHSERDEVSGKFLSEVRRVFDDAAALVFSHDDAVHEELFQ